MMKSQMAIYVGITLMPWVTDAVNQVVFCSPNNEPVCGKCVVGLSRLTDEIIWSLISPQKGSLLWDVIFMTANIPSALRTKCWKLVMTSCSFSLRLGLPALYTGFTIFISSAAVTGRLLNRSSVPNLCSLMRLSSTWKYTMNTYLNILVDLELLGTYLIK